MNLDTIPESLETEEEPLTIVAASETPNLDTMARADGPAIFSEFEKEAAPLLEKADQLAVTPETALVVADVAAAYRKQIKKVRCAAEVRRKELTEGIKRQAKAIDVLAGKIWDRCEAAEKKLLEIEQYAERQEQSRLDALVADRSAKVREAEGNPAHYALRDMDEAAFQEQLGNLLAGQASRKAAAIKSIMTEKRVEQMEAAANRKMTPEERGILGDMATNDFEASLHEAAAATAELARLKEEARKAEEAAREAQRIENERLRKEAAEREALLAKEREEAAAKLKAEREAAADRQREIEAKADKERAEADRKRLEAEESARKEIARIQDETRRLRDEKEERERAEREAEENRIAAERAAAAAPDKEKLLAFVNVLAGLNVPEMATPEGAKIRASIVTNLSKLVANIETHATKLTQTESLL